MRQYIELHATYEQVNEGLKDIERTNKFLEALSKAGELVAKQLQDDCIKVLRKNPQN